MRDHATSAASQIGAGARGTHEEQSEEEIKNEEASSAFRHRHRINLFLFLSSSTLPTHLELLGLLVFLGAHALLRELLRGELEVEDLVEQLVAHPAAGRRSGAH